MLLALTVTLIAVLSNITAVQRIAYVSRTLGRSPHA
jgi:hypothetical protein